MKTHRRSRRSTAGTSVAVTLAVMLAGCEKPWRPPINGVQRQDVPSAFRLADYVPDQPGWRWVYRRIRDGQEIDTYVRQFEQGIYAEGTLVGRSFLPLAKYAQQHTPPASQPAATQPGSARRKRPAVRRAPLRGDLGVIILFDQPLPPFPTELRIDEPVIWRVELECCGDDGEHWYDGRARRRVRLEGLEDVRVGEVGYPGCLRLQIATQFHFHWGPIFELVQYVWLARGVGEVRRIEHVRGWVLLLPFSATEEYELIDYVPSTTGATQPGWLDRTFAPWQALAIELSETLPRPRLAGLRIELGERDASPPEVAFRHEKDKTSSRR